MKTIVLANRKGGCGKTTSALAIASILIDKGYKTLFIDTDPQCNCTSSYHAETDGVATLFDLIVSDDIRVEDTIQHTDIGDIIACDPELDTYDIQALRDIPRSDKDAELKIYTRLKDKITALKEYDFIVMDTNPSSVVLFRNALIAADEVIIPIEAEEYSVRGLSKMRDRVVEVMTSLNPHLHIAGILVVKVRNQVKYHVEMIKTADIITSQLGTKSFKTAIPQNADVGKAQLYKVPLIKYNPKAPAAKSYIKVTEELLEDIQARG